MKRQQPGRSHFFNLLFVFCFSALQVCVVSAQNNHTQVYDDFEGNRLVMYNVYGGGAIDTNALNPRPDSVNRSQRCAKYTRSPDKKFDNVKLQLSGRLADVSGYATYTGVPPKFKMKIFTNAPVGTLVEVQLGAVKAAREYPDGTHSQYQIRTTKQGEWEELEFRFAQIPPGSVTAATDIDQITLLFDPNSESADVFFFDDLTGPAVVQPISDEQSDVKQKNKK